MRKIFLSLILILCFASSSYAAPAYGTNMPGKNKFSARLESYTLFKRYLENDYGKLRSQQQFFGLSYGILNWLSIDLKAGGGNIKQRPTGADEIDYATNFAGGYGFRLKFYDQKKIKGVFGFQHISVHPKTAQVGPVDQKAILDDWQVSLLGSYDLGKAVPYLGTRWSRMDYIHKVNGDRKRIMSDLGKSIGLIVGVDIPVTEKFWVGLEGQFFDS